MGKVRKATGLYEVYDANDQFLGYSSSSATGDPGYINVTDSNGSNIVSVKGITTIGPPIRIPSLDKEVVIALNYGTPPFVTFYYTTADCSGTAYAGPIASYQVVGGIDYSTNPPSYHYYVGQGAPQNVTIQSYSTPGWACNMPSGPITFPTPGYFVQIAEVTLPFLTPVALPLRFKVVGTH